MQETMVCSQTKTYELMYTVLTAKQRDVIATTPLGELLKIRNVHIRRKTCKKVADTYNLEWHGFAFGDQLLHIQLEDVANILGLPSEGGEPNLQDIDPKDDNEKARARKKEELYQLYKDRDGSTISYDGLVHRATDQSTRRVDG